MRLARIVDCTVLKKFLTPGRAVKIKFKNNDSILNVISLAKPGGSASCTLQLTDREREVPTVVSNPPSAHNTTSLPRLCHITQRLAEM